MFVSMLKRKTASAGADVIEFSTFKTRLSQYDQKADAYIKKPLSQRWHVLPMEGRFTELENLNFWRNDSFNCIFLR